MHSQMNVLWISYWLGNAGVGSAYIRQDYADESLKQTSTPLERGKQTNKNNIHYFAEFWQWCLIIFCLYQETLIQTGNIAYKLQASAYIGKNMLTLFDLTFGKNTEDSVIGA